MIKNKKVYPEGFIPTHIIYGKYYMYDPKEEVFYSLEEWVNDVDLRFIMYEGSIIDTDVVCFENKDANIVPSNMWKKIGD